MAAIGPDCEGEPLYRDLAEEVGLPEDGLLPVTIEEVEQPRLQRRARPIGVEPQYGHRDGGCETRHRAARNVMLCFAYGSNMDWDQMRERCPSARFVTVAALPDHKLCFTRRSKKRDCGVADAVFHQGSTVWGAVFEVEAIDVGRLDAKEGYRPGREARLNSYVRTERHVLDRGDTERPICVAVYFAQAQGDPPLPNQEYKNLIIAGAKRWQLPAEYIDHLNKIEVA